MAIDTTWTNPTTLARAAGQTFPYAYYEDLASNVNALGGSDGNSKTGQWMINQGADDGDCLGCESSDVAHGVTGPGHTTTRYFAVRKMDGAAGGAQLIGISEGIGGIQLRGIQTTDDTTHTAAGIGCVSVDAFLKSGTGVTAVGANGNLFTVRNAGNTKFIVDSEGDLFVDGSSTLTVFDHHEDGRVARTIRALLSPAASKLRKDHGDVLTEYASVVTEAGIVTPPAQPGDAPFVNMKRLNLFQLDALYQFGERIITLEKDYTALKAELAALMPGRGGG